LGTEYLPGIAAGYALLILAIFASEVRRTRAAGPDVLSLFMAVFVLQCCAPGVVIFGCLPFTGVDQPTDIPAFDRIFAAVDLPSALLVLGLTASFAFFLYVFMALGGTVMRQLIPGSSDGGWFVLRGSATGLLILVTLGLVLSLAMFWSLGDTLVDRYIRLIELRANYLELELNSLSKFALPLMQCWCWLSIVALFLLFERRGRDLVWYCCLTCSVILAVLSVSRRAIFIPILLAYFTLVLFGGRWRLKWLLMASIPILLWVAFGKEMLAAIASGGTSETVITRYDTPMAGALRTASEVGVTVVESLGSVSLLDLPPRLGMDHFLSLMHGPPTTWFLHWAGQDDALPKRVVRLSTEAFATSRDEDIPPGVFGQMWLDFRIFGPLVWAFAFAVQLTVVQRVFVLMARTRQAVAALVVVTFVIALPLNNGSYDFSFSSDVIGVTLSLLATFRIARVRLNPSDVSSVRG
jgi:hypothetical protein